MDFLALFSGNIITLLIFSINILIDIEDENINSPIILGHSMGGKAALLFAEKYPKYLDKLIVADIGIKEYPFGMLLNTIFSFNLKRC